MSSAAAASPDLLERVVSRSRYLDLIPLGTGNVLGIQSIVQSRLVLKPEVVAILDSLAAPRRVSDWLEDYCPSHGLEREAGLRAVKGLLEASFLFAGTAEEEERRYAGLLSQFYGRDPEAARAAAARFSTREVPRFLAPAPRGVASFAGAERRLDVVVVGLCDVQIGMDVMREEARAAGIDLRLHPTFETTLETLAETPHDAVIVGHLAARHGHWNRADGGGDLLPERYSRAVRALLERLRGVTRAPILVRNLPVPTCSPLGFAERGRDALRERARLINRELVELADGLPDVYVVDVDAVLSLEGKRRLLDDRVMSFSHLGGLGWWSMLPEAELRFVHGVRPPLERLSELGVGDPLEYDRALAAEEVALLRAIFGIGRRKCVVVDLDGTLWPGVLADTGAPFPSDAPFEVWSYHGFFLGVHEALKALKARGVLLAVASKNDEEVVRRLWKYPPRAPLDRLLVPEDFASMRIGWGEKADAILEICEELGLAPNAVVFVDDSPVEREKVARALPDVLVLGQNPFAVRGELLTHPSLQLAVVTEESQKRTEMVRAQVEREKARRAAHDPAEFLASLGIRCAVSGRLDPRDLDRVHELVARTNQFNTTGRRFTKQELEELAAGGGLYTLRVEDRFTDYGLVGACAAVGDTIELFVISCRVIGLGAERVFLRAVVADRLAAHSGVKGLLRELERNLPARGLFRENGFAAMGQGVFELPAAAAFSLPPLPGHYDLELREVRVPEGFPLPVKAPAPAAGGR